jgi:hypothetical protein
MIQVTEATQMFLPAGSLIKCVNTSADDINAGNEKWGCIFER